MFDVMKQTLITETVDRVSLLIIYVSISVSINLNLFGLTYIGGDCKNVMQI